MPSFSGLVKVLSSLVSGTPANDDCFIFGKTDLKKVTLSDLKKVLGVRISDSVYETNESMYDVSIKAKAFNIGLSNATGGKTETISIDLPDAHSAWIDASNSYVYSSYSAYPITYIDHNMANMISAYINFQEKKLVIELNGDWTGYTAWIIVKYYNYE